MAKRKLVALFEVIRKDKRFSQQGGSLQTPAWFKSKPAGAPAPSPVVLTARLEPVEPKPITPIAPAAPAHFAEQPAQPIQQDATDSWPIVPNGEMPAPLDRGTRKKFGGSPSPLTPTSAAIIAAAVLVVVASGLAIRHFHHRHSAAETALNGPPHSEDLNVGPAISPHASPPLAFGPQANPAAATEGPTRQPNMCYALVRSYANQKTANEICTYLTANGIPCTIEHNLRGVEGHYYTVLGLTPFASGGTPEYAAYVQRMREVLASLPGATQVTKSIRPQLRKWGQSAGPA